MSKRFHLTPVDVWTLKNLLFSLLGPTDYDLLSPIDDKSVEQQMHEADQIQAKVISQTPEMIHQIIQSFSTENGETSFDESFQRFEVHYDLTEEEFQFIKIHLTHRIIDLDFSSFNLLRDSSKLAYYLLMNNLNDNLR